MKLKGAWKRTKKEYKYTTKSRWSYKDCGRFWDTVHDYDEIDDETYAYKRRFYDSIKMLGRFKAKNALDVDCRTGNGTVFYHRNGRLKTAECVSPSEVFLSVCKKRLAKYKIKGNTTLLRRLPLKFPSERFDLVLCFETMEHIAPRERAQFLAELNRVMSDDGRMILTMPNILWEPVHWMVAIFAIHHSEGPHRFFRRKKALRLLRESGFAVVKENTTVIIPQGPRWFTRFGEKIEKLVGRHIRNVFALRHIFICQKATSARFHSK